MPASNLLPDVFGTEPGSVTVLLFSQRDCEFCEEMRDNYLKPLAATRPRRIVVAEVELDGSRRLRTSPQGAVTQAEFSRAMKVRFAPTLMFLGPKGESLAEPIVGLSRDFFGAYLEQRIAIALRAAS